MRLRTLAIGAVVLALLATMIGLGVAAAIAHRDGWFAGFGAVELGGGAFVIQGTPVERTLAVPTGVTVEVAIDRGDVRVTAGGVAAVVVVTPTVRADDRDAGLAALASISPTIRFADGRLEVRWTGADAAGGRRIAPGVDVAIRLPAAAGASLSARTRAGDIAVDGVAGPIAVETDFGDVAVVGGRDGVRARSAAGDVEARDIEAPAGAVELATEFGDVRLARVRVKALQAESSSGDIDAAAVRATAAAGIVLRTRFGDVDVAGAEAAHLVAASDSGDVRLVLTRLAGGIEASTRFGDVDVSLPPGAGAEATLHTRFGSVEAPFVDAGRAADVARAADRGTPWVGRVGAGGPSVALSTDSGDVRLSVGSAADR